MKKSVLRLITTATMASLLALPGVASAAGDEQAPAPVPPKPNNIKLETAGAFTSLAIGKNIYVYNDKGQIFQTKGAEQNGLLMELFTISYGPEQVPLILVKNKNGLMVFSDLWPKFAPDQANNEIEAYDSGRVFYEPKSKIVSKTAHHYAEQIGDEAVVYTANNFDDLKEGYHESYRVKGKLRGLIIYDCCAYGVIANENNELIVYHAGEKGAEQSGVIEF